ncbi:hypothetical protein O6H91_10G102700 [Diphasiastrum complanatum]|uniref:Uncharacterized protein n=1 Tax=Diphasiastrum complanatum TaxID=34168 RepID=A0ACC2CKA2_DIPCM|nr:hypothetical protein O6H91_10G102700 [Diphasiastrum complanatum]
MLSLHNLFYYQVLLICKLHSNESFLLYSLPSAHSTCNLCEITDAAEQMPCVNRMSIYWFFLSMLCTKYENRFDCLLIKAILTVEVCSRLSIYFVCTNFTIVIALISQFYFSHV